MRIGLDVMGGDLAPDPILQGGLDSLSLLGDDDCLVLFGDESVIRAGVEAAGPDDDVVHISNRLGHGREEHLRANQPVKTLTN